MRKTALFTALLMAVLPALVSAYPGIGGGRGLLRVQNALVEDEAGLTLSAHGLGRNAKFLSNNNKKGWVLDLVAPELSYAPLVTKYVALEMFGSWGGVFQMPKTPDQDGVTMSTHDLKAGGKVSVPILPVLKLGFTGSYTFLSGRGPRAGVEWLDKHALPQAGDPDIPGSSAFSWAGLMTLQLQDVLPTAPNVMVNYGKLNDETRYGLGVELAGKGFALFGEVLSRQGPGSVGLFDTDSGSVYLTPGVVFGNVSSFSFKAAYSFAFGHKANNELIAGIALATPFGRRAKPEFGTITGKVTDEKTGAALAAKVEFPANDQLPSLSTGANGVFEVKNVRTGVTVVKVGAPGYQSQSVPLDVRKGAVVSYDFKLRSLVAYGTIAGTVTDAGSNRPLAATIAFPEAKLKSVSSAAATGAFRVDQVPTGVYTVTAEADGYFKGTQTVQVEDGQVAAPMFALKPLTDVSTFTGKVSDKATNAPLVATISFPGSSVGSIKSAAGTGVFSTEIPVGSYAVKVEAEDYIVQTAAIVIEKDKPQVKNFELVKEGMSITLRGIYFDYDKATIKPESRPALEDAAKILKENPSIRVEIQGHTDSDGSDSYNQQLSDRRAAAVVSYLVRNLGIDAGRLTSRGYGESNPVASNSTAEGKALNRRVEFFILGQQK
ncbi:OmpA family protein [candidate division WOR-3 bacterium]|nr:OmpA family protein [candidate division WOR-3 bacterium]